MSYSYETLYILRTDLTEDQIQQEVNKYRDFLVESKAEDLQIKVWGKKRLAYPIKKQQDGVYVQMNYLADGKQVAPMERAMRLSDEVIRYLTLKIEEDKVDLEQVPTPPVAVEPQAIEPQAPQAIEPQAIEPQAIEPQAIEPQAIEPEGEKDEDIITAAEE